jgi:hypothetical protein
MKRIKATVSRRELFWEPDPGVSPCAVIDELHGYVAKYGSARIARGAIESDISDWIKRYHSVAIVELQEDAHVREEPVLFYARLACQDDSGSDSIDMLFTPRNIYRLSVCKPPDECGPVQAIARLAHVSKTELGEWGSSVPDLGYCLAQDLECMLWRMDHNPREPKKSSE